MNNEYKSALQIVLIDLNIIIENELSSTSGDEKLDEYPLTIDSQTFNKVHGLYKIVGKQKNAINYIKVKILSENQINFIIGYKSLLAKKENNKNVPLYTNPYYNVEYTYTGKYLIVWSWQLD